MRLLWPALGATMAVLVCLSVALASLKSTSSERPVVAGDELEAMNPAPKPIHCVRTTTRASIATSTSSWTATGPAAISIPRVMDDGASVAGISRRRSHVHDGAGRQSRRAYHDCRDAELRAWRRTTPSARSAPTRSSARRGEAVAIRAGADADRPHGCRQYGVVDLRDHGADARSADAPSRLLPWLRARGVLPPADPAVPLPVGRQSSASAPHRRPEAAGSRHFSSRTRHVVEGIGRPQCDAARHRITLEHELELLEARVGDSVLRIDRLPASPSSE